MQSKNLTAIAEAAGVSVSTVSKVLNRCGGVSSAVRQAVLAAAEAVGDTADVPGVPAPDVYIILPAVPAFFWSVFRDSLTAALDGHGLSLRLDLYTEKADEDTVLRYVRDAELLRPRVLVLAASGNEALAPALTRLSEAGTLVITLCEYPDCPAAFYFGSDRRADGALLADWLNGAYPEVCRVLMLCSQDATDRLRCDGFADRMRTLRPSGIECRAVDVKVSTVGAKSALLARTLAPLYAEYPFDAAVCLNGYSDLLCLALRKCRIPVPCLGFEHTPEDDKYMKDGTLVCEVCQDIPATARAAAGAVLRYLEDGTLPPERRTYVPSHLLAGQ